MLRTTAVLPAALAALLLPARAPSPDTPPPGTPPPEARPVVLMLHGRGMQRQDTTTLRRAWATALDEGIAGIAGHGLLEPGDLRLVWYADALQPRGASPCDAAGDGAAREEGWARDVGATLAAAGTLMELAAAWLGGYEGAALQALAGDLLYLGDPRRRCGAEVRLAAALERAERERRPVILVAHSFGSLVAYHHLRTRDAAATTPIERLVTVGSLLGHPELREILLADDGGTGPPPGVGSWVNVHDPSDPLSAPLVGMDDPERPGAVEDRVTERPVRGDPHDPARYLADPATAGAVLEAWCGAGGGAACHGLPRPF
ncbi:MAG: hypothetical protein KY453_11425 [Gemmatimonadetes bacterium]|nr:hypothetical protein [Gemmatimonadota bacterium]